MSDEIDERKEESPWTVTYGPPDTPEELCRTWPPGVTITADPIEKTLHFSRDVRGSGL